MRAALDGHIAVYCASEHVPAGVPILHAPYKQLSLAADGLWFIKLAYVIAHWLTPASKDFAAASWHNFAAAIQAESAHDGALLQPDPKVPPMQVQDVALHFMYSAILGAASADIIQALQVGSDTAAGGGPFFANAAHTVGPATAGVVPPATGAGGGGGGAVVSGGGGGFGQAEV